jgi:hypothetical protein
MAKKPNETSLVKQGSFDPTQLSDIHRNILYALSQLFEATFEEIAAYLHVEKSTIWKRLSELDKKGLIYHPGTKKALRSGRAGKIWRLTDCSLPKTTTAEKMLKGPGIAYFSRKINDIAKSIPSSNIAKTLF